jgi:predicted dehydrogenase
VTLVGIIGAGIAEGYIAGFQRQPDVNVTAICARTSSRVIPLIAKYAIPRRYNDYECMLAEEPLDVVITRESKERIQRLTPVVC